MLLKSQIVISCLSFCLIISCTPKAGKSVEAPVHPKEPNEFSATKPDMAEEPMEEVMLDDLIVNPHIEPPLDSIPTYHGSATKRFDLLHTVINIAFDYKKKHAPATARLTLSPWFHPAALVELDAKNFTINKVTLASGKELKYTYDGEKLLVNLDRTYTRTEKLDLIIDYVARPDERSEIGGSAAISSDKGLYFIDADESDPEKPTQIWTQGETEASSRWFPTIDKPNERCTQEIYMTVDNKYKTLSNGILVSSKPNTNGTRTDYWKMDKPHAPYLFMMAVGEFAKVSDKWRNIPVDYYVEPKFEPYARDIYPHTVEMLEFFSTKLNYTYPWPSFSQIVVRDYVSGAMENTTAVIFGDFIQMDSRSLLDDHWTNEKIVAHEMFHHWFGDLVTCESWANLTLNEGFANYSEYLWLEHKHGREEADAHLEEEHGGFFGSNDGGGRPAIHYHYGDKEEMFDAVSYNKGGSILHMLRKYLGDEAFFAGLSSYLRKNEYTDVESDELRIAMEDVSGEDLHWFFDQWYVKGGFPVLDLTYAYDETAKEVRVSVQQLQQASANQVHVFNIPAYIDIYANDGTKRRESVRVTKREQSFRFAVGEKPLFVNFDGEKSLLCQKADNHTQDEWEAMFMYGPLYFDKMEALTALSSIDGWYNSSLLEAGLKDKSRAVRQKCLDLLKVPSKGLLQTLATTDKDPGVRAAAIAKYGEVANPEDLPLLRDNLKEDKPYSVVAASLEAVNRVAPDSAANYVKVLENVDNDKIVEKIAKIYAKSGAASAASWFESKAKTSDFMGAFTFFEYYQKYVATLGDATTTTKTVESWYATATDGKQSQWRRFATTKAIADMRNHMKKTAKTAGANSQQIDALNKMLTDIKAQETDKTLLMYYEMF